MENFTYYTPTKVIFGKGTETETGAAAKQFGATKALLHFGGKSAKASGLLNTVKESLENAGIKVTELGGVMPNPRLSLVREGIALGKKEKIDFIVAVGGGSVIDSAKAISYGIANDGDVWDFYEGTRTPQAGVPVGAVLTIAAAGSEMSGNSVINNDEAAPVIKRGFNHDVFGRAKFAVMNPELTFTVPEYHTAAGCTDILMHTMERYFTRITPPHMEITDSVAEALMRTVLHNSRILSRKPQDYQARAEIMWASSLSHNGLTGCGAGGGDWACHQMGHELSAKYDLSHGAALAAIWGSWARYVYKEDPARFAQFAKNVMEVPEEATDEETALMGIEEMEGFFWAIEMPTSIEEAGIELTDEDLHTLALGCSRGGKRTVGSMKALETKDMEEIYRMARSADE